MHYNLFLYYQLSVQAVPNTNIVQNSILETNIIADPIIETSLYFICITL